MKKKSVAPKKRTARLSARANKRPQVQPFPIPIGPPLKAADIEELRLDMNLTELVFCNLLGVGHSILSKWKAGNSPNLRNQYQLRRLRQRWKSQERDLVERVEMMRIEHNLEVELSFRRRNKKTGRR